MTIYQKLEDKYFDALEENGVQCSELQTHDEGYSEMLIKEEYQHKTVQEMCEYLEMPEWVIEWTHDLIHAEETVDQYIDSATEYGRVKNEPMTKESEVL